MCQGSPIILAGPHSWSDPDRDGKDGGGPVGAGEEDGDEGLHGARAVGIGEEVEEVPVGQEEVPRERHPLLVQHLRGGGG